MTQNSDGSGGGSTDSRAALEARIRAALGAGDLEAAATEAIRGYGREIFRYLRGVLHGDEDAAEVFSQFCEDLWRSFPRFRGESSLRTWAYRLAWCGATDFLRRGQRKYEEPLRTTHISKLAQQIRTETPSFLGPAAKSRMARLREELSADERSLLALRVDQALSWKEVAEVMAETDPSLDEAVLRKRFERLKRHIRDLAQSDTRD